MLLLTPSWKSICLWLEKNVSFLALDKLTSAWFPCTAGQHIKRNGIASRIYLRSEKYIWERHWDFFTRLSDVILASGLGLLFSGQLSVRSSTRRTYYLKPVKGNCVWSRNLSCRWILKFASASWREQHRRCFSNSRQFPFHALGWTRQLINN